MSKSTKNKAVYFDRDGVLTLSFINHKIPKSFAAKHPSKLRLFRTAPKIVHRLKALGYKIIVVSNQPDIVLNKISEQTKLDLEKKFLKLIQSNKVPIDDIYYCNHHEKGVNPNYKNTCNCRKPKPGMLKLAAKKWSIDLKNSYMIGDSWRDVEAGNNAGCTSILLERKWSKKEKCNPSFTIKALKEVLDIIK